MYLAAKDKIADFKPLFESMLEVASYEQSVLRTTRTLLLDDAANDFEAFERTRRMALPLVSSEDSMEELSDSVMDTPANAIEAHEQKLVDAAVDPRAETRLQALNQSPAPILHRLLRRLEDDKPLDVHMDGGPRRGALKSYQLWALILRRNSAHSYGSANGHCEHCAACAFAGHAQHGSLVARLTLLSRFAHAFP